MLEQVNSRLAIALHLLHLKRSDIYQLTVTDWIAYRNWIDAHLAEVDNDG